MKAMRTTPVAKLVVVIDDNPLVLEATGGQGLTGVDAIERLRSAFGKIPALLISADASSPRCEVGPRSYELLYKPVNAERFHAALVDASVLRRQGVYS